MLTIRLQRTGKKNQADFRIVLAEKESPVNKKVTEILGAYNPRKKVLSVREERLKYWLSLNIEASPTVHNLLVSKGLKTGAKVKAFNVPKKPVVAQSPEAAKPASESAEAAPAAEPETPTEQPVTDAAPSEVPAQAETPAETPVA